jgi:hypothetical protein
MDAQGIPEHFEDPRRDEVRILFTAKFERELKLCDHRFNQVHLRWREGSESWQETVNQILISFH